MAENDVEKRDDAGINQEQNPSELYATPIPPAQSNKPPTWMWFGLGGLVILALAVIFVLPTIVSEYELPLERRVEVPPSQPTTAAREQSSGVSPFEEAQRARQRSESQDVLSELLEIQNELEAVEVENWAGASYDQALSQASSGDEYYRTQDFGSATAAYTEARANLAAIRDSIPEVFGQLIEEGAAAIAAGDAGLAEDRYSLALLLDPDSEAAEIGLQRSRSLEEVAVLFEQAESLAEQGQLAAARDLYSDIVDLDTYNERARSGVDEMTARIRQDQFSRVMSEGYASLQENNPEAAIEAFRRAATLGVNAAQAEAAIVQTETEVANARINALRQQIAAAESAEEWQAAVGHYDAVLTIDPNLLFAQEGRDYAAKRAQLNQLLVNGINNPERFADDAVFQEIVDVYYTGRSIENPGPRLQVQLDELETLLETSQVPIEVALVSDNLTNVTLLREGELGSFERRTVSLKPGRYVAVGRRAGYREVRKEFVVGFGQTPDQVVVRCEERVVGGSR